MLIAGSISKTKNFTKGFMESVGWVSENKDIIWFPKEIDACKFVLLLEHYF